MLRIGRRVAPLVAAVTMALLAASPILAHEQRIVDGYLFDVGFVEEPVYAGVKNGLALYVARDDVGVEGLDAPDALTAEVLYGTFPVRKLPLQAVPNDPGRYESVFFPTAAGPYTFHIFGTVNDNPIDESFTSSQTGFNSVQDAARGQYPVVYPPTAELVSGARAGRDANAQVPFALGLGITGTLVGMISLGLSLANRRRSTRE